MQPRTLNVHTTVISRTFLLERSEQFTFRLLVVSVMVASVTAIISVGLFGNCGSGVLLKRPLLEWPTGIGLLKRHVPELAGASKNFDIGHYLGFRHWSLGSDLNRTTSCWRYGPCLILICGSERWTELQSQTQLTVHSAPSEISFYLKRTRNTRG